LIFACADSEIVIMIALDMIFIKGFL